MASVWSEDHNNLPRFPQWEGNGKTEVLIVGGGMAGILCAHFLQSKGIDYILVEGKTICSGVTQNTTAKITSQHGLFYDKLIRKAGVEKARLYLEVNQKAVETYAGLCQNIDCDFERKPSYVYARMDRKKLEDEAKALEQLGLSSDVVETKELPFETAGAVCFENQAQFHPLKFVSQIARGLRIYDNTFVKELKDHTAVTDHGEITFQKIIFATHFPIDNKHGLYFLKMYQHRSYVIALEQADQIKGMYVDEATCGMSFRNYKNLLFIGGGDHRTGKKGGCWQELRDFAGQYYPNGTERCHWATQDCMTLDSVPYIGPYSRSTPDYFVATGFQKWGMTSSMVAAMILSDLVTEQENPYAQVFLPWRSMWTPQLLINGWEALRNLLTISPKRCPHLGCALKWNEIEHTWDCPCHGSRFDEVGHVLENPANGDLRK